MTSSAKYHPTPEAEPPKVPSEVVVEARDPDIDDKTTVAADSERTATAESEELPPLAALLREVIQPLRDYHNHEVTGLDHVPLEGPVIIVTNHSLATYDGFLLGLGLYEATGRVPAGLGHDLIFNLPLLGRLARSLGIAPASPLNGERMLRDGRMLCIAPGGMHEALRPTRERYQIRWEHHRGFARLAVRTGAPVLPAACPAADNLFTVVDNPVTDFIYKQLKVPLPLFYGDGPIRGRGPIPRQVKLTHHIAPPLSPPSWDPQHEEQLVTAFHAEVVSVMQRLMTENAPSKN